MTRDYGAFPLVLQWAKSIGRGFLPEVINIEATSFDNALEGSLRDRLVTMHGDNHLPAIGMTPFLMTALLTG
ncbi:MAG TPA: hypothetical protein VKO18_14505 [Terriglobia bacterium]|nr:hypothetical protein [Terriglobia bacterium]